MHNLSKSEKKPLGIRECFRFLFAQRIQNDQAVLTYCKGGPGG